MKRTLLVMFVMVLSLNMIGCNEDVEDQSQPITEPEVQEEISSSEVEETESDLDPLVQYALNNIDFEFVSDTGLYWDYQNIAENNYSNADMIKDINILSDHIEEQEFSILRNKILQVPDYNNLMREVKVNYIVPILMHEDNYLDALRIQYKKEEIESTEDRYLFDIIYLMRYMYVNNNLEHAVEVVDQLKEEYPNENVSYVWFAISPRQYDNLNNYGLVYPPSEDSDRNKLWNHLVENYPDDPHLDYAYYFLGDYQKIIDDYPYSKLTEKAYYARANYYRDSIVDAIYDDEKELDRVDLELTKEFYTEYLQKYSDSRFTYKAVYDVSNLCDLMYSKYDEDVHYYDFIYALMSMQDNDYVYERNRTIGSILRSMKYEFIYGKDLVEMSEHTRQYLENEDIYDSYKYDIWSGLANNAFYKGELELADEYFRNIDKYNYDNFDLYRLISLSELKPYLGRNDAEALFKKAEVLRSNEEYFASVYIYDKLVKLNLSNEDLSKAYMLRASSSKKNRVYDEMLESYEYIVENLDRTSFADDALAEIGVHYLLAEEEYEKSREIFREVIEKYPERNAVNNAYNWIAWSYLREKDYENALVAYEELKEKFPLNRFGRNAIPNIKKIKELMEEEN